LCIFRFIVVQYTKINRKQQTPHVFYSILGFKLMSNHFLKVLELDKQVYFQFSSNYRLNNKLQIKLIIQVMMAL